MVHQRRANRWHIVLALLALTWLVTGLFLPILGFDFVDLDVNSSVVGNPHIRGLTGENLKHILTSRSIASYYPIRTLTYAIDYAIWGLDPRGFKLTNGLLHWANVMLVFWMILRVFRGAAEPATARRHEAWDVWAAVFSAGLFAIHPVAVEPVTWVAGREELLMTLGALACFHFHLSARRLSLVGGKKGLALTCHVAAAVSCAFACLSNAVAAVIPLLIVAWDVLTLAGPRWKKILGGSAALWVIALATITVKGPGADAALTQDIGIFTAERVMLVLNVYWRNLATVAWPAALSVSYEPLRPKGLLDAEVVLGGAAACLSCLVIWKLRSWKPVLYGLLWFCLALAPTAQVLPHHVHRADRFLYLPLAGLALAVAAGIRTLGTRLRSRAVTGAAVALGLLVLVALNLRSAAQVRTWRDSLTMWENCVKVCPNSGFAHDVLARNLRRRGLLDRAEEHARRSLELDFVDNHGALSKRAMGLAVLPGLELADRQEAVRIARRACELTRWEDPECLHALATAYCSVARAQIEIGQFASAADNCYRSLEADERCVDALFNLAILRMSCPEPGLRDPEEAVRLAERGCKAQRQPTPDKLAVLAEAYARSGRLEMAVATGERAVEIARAAGNSRAVDELRRWVETQRAHSATPANGAGEEPEPGPASGASRPDSP